MLKSSYSELTLPGSGNLNIDIEETISIYKIETIVTLTGNVTIQHTGSVTDENGSVFILYWEPTVTTAGFSVTVMGKVLTDKEATSNGIITAYFDEVDNAWTTFYLADKAADLINSSDIEDGTVQLSDIVDFAQYTLLMRTTAGSGSMETMTGSADVASLLQAANFSTMRSLMGLAALATKAQADLTTDVTGILPIANGGTNSATASGARTNLGLGALAVLSTITTSEISASAVTTNEIADDAVTLEKLASTGQLSSKTASTGTPASTTETSLYSATIPANTISSDGDTIEFTAWGQFAANNNNKTLRMKINGITIASNSVETNPNNLSFMIRYTGIRTGSAAQNGIVEIIFENLATETVIVNETEDFTTAMTYEITGENGTAVLNDIVAYGGHVKSSRES